jgi:hypothetical protein
MCDFDLASPVLTELAQDTESLGHGWASCGAQACKTEAQALKTFVSHPIQLQRLQKHTFSNASVRQAERTTPSIGKGAAPSPHTLPSSPQKSPTPHIQGRACPSQIQHSTQGLQLPSCWWGRGPEPAAARARPAVPKVRCQAVWSLAQPLGCLHFKACGCPCVCCRLNADLRERVEGAVESLDFRCTVSAPCPLLLSQMFLCCVCAASYVLPIQFWAL